MRFRPCIDLHAGKVKQIVGGTLTDSGSPQTNFVSEKSAAYYAALYRDNKLKGGHLICLGPGNDEAARSALMAYPNGLQIGGGLNAENGKAWLDAGASALIFTSYLFENGTFSEARLDLLTRQFSRENLVIDLSCRKREGRYFVMVNRWQTWTDLELNQASLERLAPFATEFLIHAVDQEGKQSGVDADLIRLLSASTLPVVYAGGIHSNEDIALIEKEGKGKVDFTVGSALDLFGGRGVKYAALVEREKRIGNY
ncbi:MAG: phosphoribosylformimino-5-aminoimidazole carboxamide ribotide isomerase [Spirochaetia bacterium]|nr:phosphoribosylformimino-5-aminoimidazole carboxamide ribotide isomerase [Spirochaetia bacterium]